MPVYTIMLIDYFSGGKNKYFLIPGFSFKMFPHLALNWAALNIDWCSFFCQSTVRFKFL